MVKKINNILSFHISEKSTRLSEKYKQYIFQVTPNTNKKLIKKTLEKLFDVKIISIRSLNIKGKKKRLPNNSIGQQKRWKKLYIRVDKECSIDLLHK